MNVIWEDKCLQKRNYKLVDIQFQFFFSFFFFSILFLIITQSMKMVFILIIGLKIFQLKLCCVHTASKICRFRFRYSRSSVGFIVRHIFRCCQSVSLKTSLQTIYEWSVCTVLYKTVHVMHDNEAEFENSVKQFSHFVKV